MGGDRVDALYLHVPVQGQSVVQAGGESHVGVSVGYTIVKTYDTVVVQLIWKPIVENGGWGVDSGRYRDAHGHALCPESRLDSWYAFAFIVGVGSDWPFQNDLLLHLETDRGHGSPYYALVPGEEVTFTWNLSNPASSVNTIIILLGDRRLVFRSCMQRWFATKGIFLFQCASPGLLLNANETY